MIIKRVRRVMDRSPADDFRKSRLSACAHYRPNLGINARSELFKRTHYGIVPALKN